MKKRHALALALSLVSIIPATTTAHAQTPPDIKQLVGMIDAKVRYPWYVSGVNVAKRLFHDSGCRIYTYNERFNVKTYFDFRKIYFMFKAGQGSGADHAGIKFQCRKDVFGCMERYVGSDFGDRSDSDMLFLPIGDLDIVLRALKHLRSYC